MIGIELLPAITKMVNRLTNFVQEHGNEIRDFFRDAAKFAEGMGRAIKNDVLPFIQKIGDVWAGVPDDLKKILIGGFVLNKATGGAITGIVGELAKGLIKGVLGITAGVVNINAATVNGGGAPGAGAPAACGVGAGGSLGGATIGAAGHRPRRHQGHRSTLPTTTARKYPALHEGGTHRHPECRDNGGLREHRAARRRTRSRTSSRRWGPTTSRPCARRRPRSTAASPRPGRRSEQRRAPTSAIHGDTSSTNRNLDQVTVMPCIGTTTAVRNKKLAVNVDVSQRQRQAIRANICGHERRASPASTTRAANDARARRPPRAGQGRRGHRQPADAGHLRRGWQGGLRHPAQPAQGHARRRRADRSSTSPSTSTRGASPRSRPAAASTRPMWRHEPQHHHRRRRAG